jgi:hypothetical protein
MKRVLAACAIVGVCMSVRVAAQSEAGYRANIGKTAVSAADGTEIGRIVDVALMNGIWVYKVQREGKTISSPVDTIVAKGAVSKPVKAPEASRAARTSGTAAPDANIDPVLQRTATAFREELVRHQGVLHTLVITPKGISAKWLSAKCSYFESELIDLLLSIKRTQKASPAIVGTHTCEGRMRTFTVKGETFHQYRVGEITEAKVLAAIKP